MPIQNRTVTVTGIFAENATTDIPANPVAGVSYRDTSLTPSEVKQGWPFKEIVDSSKFNQHGYELSTIVKQLETYGFLPWSNLTNYEAGSFALGTDGGLYFAVQQTGPSTTAFDPVQDTSHTYWRLYSEYFATKDYVTNKFVVVNSLPSNPDANTFYFIKA